MIQPSYEELQSRVRELEAQLSSSCTRDLDQAGAGTEFDYLVQYMMHEVHVWKVIRDDQGEIKTWSLVYANPAALNSWHMKLCDIIGKNTEDIFTNGDPVEQFLPLVKKIFEEQKPHVWEHYFPATKQTLQMVSIPYGDRFISTGLDITKQKMAEESINQARKMESIVQLTNGIAHEFNNQLTAIIGFADMLIDRATDEKSTLYAESIRSAAHRTADLTSQLVAFSSTGHVDMILLDPHIVINKLIESLRILMSKNISIVTEFNAPELKILADQKQLETVLFNIASNAQAAMPKGGLIIFKTEIIRSEVQSQYRIDPELLGREYFRLTVTDTGHGILPEIKDRIFEPFFSTKENGDEKGMGLASAFGIIKRHGGMITVDSETGKGTSFHIYLPIDSHSKIPTKNLDHSEKTAQLPTALNILLVDDEELIRLLGSQMLTMLGHSVQTANGGLDAIDIYRRDCQDIHLVILDMTMPDMDSLDVFRELNRINKDVKVIAVSGFAKEGRIQTLLDEGGYLYLSKPFSMTQLEDAISNIYTS